MSEEMESVCAAAQAIGFATGSIISAGTLSEKIGNGETGRAGRRDLLEKLGYLERSVNEMQQELRRRLAKPPDGKTTPLFDKKPDRLSRLQGKGGDNAV